MWNVLRVSKKLIATIIVSSIFAGFLTYNFYHIFYKYQSDVDQILAEIPAEDKDLPPNVLKVFRNTKDVNNISNQTVKNIWDRISNQRQDLTITEWRFYSVIWKFLLPIKIGEKEEFAFFANKANLKEYPIGNYIEGFKNGAKFYFKKEWQDLTEEEVLVLLTIANYPSSFSRKGNSEIFNQKLNELVEINNRNSKSYW